MSYKFFYLYLIGGTVALVLLAYQVIADYHSVSISGLLFNIVPVILLYYLAFKVYHEKKDKEMM